MADLRHKKFRVGPTTPRGFSGGVAHAFAESRDARCGLRGCRIGEVCHPGPRQLRVIANTEDDPRSTFLDEFEQDLCAPTWRSITATDVDSTAERHVISTPDCTDDEETSRGEVATRVSIGGPVNPSGCGESDGYGLLWPGLLWPVLLWPILLWQTIQFYFGQNSVNFHFGQFLLSFSSVLQFYFLCPPSPQP